MGVLKLQASFEYIEHYVPPRCRKERERVVTEDVELDIPSVSSAEAPVAFRFRQCWFPQQATIRVWNGRLYSRIPYREKLCKAEGWYPLSEFKKRSFHQRVYTHCRQNSARDEALERLRDTASDYLIINGNEVWRTCGEPRYVVATFGLGNNHASTALMITQHYNDNIAGSRYFTALQRNEAVKEAVRIAKARGDTNSVPSIKKAWKISVVNYSAIE